jgi:hypothetical protein
VAQGLTIISRRGQRGHLPRDGGASRQAVPDALGRNPKPLKFIPVDDHLKLKDSTNEIDIYHIVGNYHMADGVIVHVPASKLLVEADSHDAGVGLQLVGRQPDEQHRVPQDQGRHESGGARAEAVSLWRRWSRRSRSRSQHAGVLPPCRRGAVLPARLPDSVQQTAAAER